MQVAFQMSNAIKEEPEDPYRHLSVGLQNCQTSAKMDSRRDRRDSFNGDRKNTAIDHDKPPFSRLFVVCCKSHSADDLRSCFDKFGTVEDVWVVKDRNTKENRGVAYIKFSKMSESTLAVEEMDGKFLQEGDDRPLKVIIAQPKSTKSTEDYSDESALTRLFVVIPKGTDDKDLKKSFEEYGDIDYVQVVKDRRTGDPKGFGYVKFRKPHSAALAVENCSASFRAVMAEPKSAKLKREHQTMEPYTPQNQHGSRAAPLQELGLNLGIGTTSVRPTIDSNPFASVISSNTGFGSLSSGAPVSNRLYVIVSPRVTQDDLGRLFDLIPGMEFCDLKKNYTTGESKGYAYIVYNSVGSAIYAKEKLNGFNYPLGCKLSVQYASDDNMGGGELPLTPKSTPVDSGDAPFLSSLPSSKPLEPEAECAERLFIVCHPNPLPDFMLRDVFSRFGGLIDVYMLRNKNFGYAKYSTIDSAEKAIKTLHGHDVHGVKLKVLQADPPRESETARKRPRT